MSPKAEHAGLMGWTVMFNVPIKGNPMDWRERKGNTKRRAWDMGKAIGLLPQKLERK